MRVSAGLLVGGACIATAATILNAFLINKQFFPAIVYLSKSSASMMILYFQGATLVYLLFQMLRALFFGQLRASEVEHLSERVWHAVLETCLAFTVFRDDFSALFVAQFIGLLFIKCFHWLAEDRVDMMERSPIITIKFHMRMMSIVAILGFMDSYLVSHAYFTTLRKGASSQIVFGFEYAVLMTLVIHITIKYLLHMHDLRTEQSWDNKAVYLLYTELFINMIRCILYGSFSIVMIRVHSFPLFSIRPFYQSFRALYKAFNDVVLSRRAINAMNNQFPMVTNEELAAMDAACIICREEMTAESSPKRLPCSHVFHAHCLRSWFQRQQTCPTCRTEIWGRQNENGAAGAAAAGAGGEQQQQQAAAAAGAEAGAGGPAIVGFPFVGHQFAFQPAAPAAQQQFPHQVFYAPPPPNRPEFLIPPPPPIVPPSPNGLPFAMPPPFQQPPLPDYAGFSDEELQLMEVQRRDAILARLRALDDVMTLLDVAHIQMRQLMQLSPLTIASTAPPPATATAPPPATATAPSNDPATSSVTVNPTPEVTEEASPAVPKSIFTAGATNPPTESIPSTSTNGEASSTARTPPDLEEMRLRRLARFDQTRRNENEQQQTENN